MATASVSNVRIMTNGDTLAGPMCVCGVVVTPGSTSSTASLSASSITLFDAGTMGASSSAAQYHGVSFSLSQGQTLTAATTGTGTKIYVYLE